MNAPVQLVDGLKTRLDATLKVLNDSFDGGDSSPNAMRGRERETFIKNYLEKIFPNQFRFASGALLDANGLMTGQLDVVIEHPALPSFPTPLSEERVVLAESAIAVIEVKSNLHTQYAQLEKTVEKVKKLKKFPSAHPRTHGFWRSSTSPTPQTIPVVAIGFKGFANTGALSEKLSQTAEPQRADALFVVEGGLFASKQGVSDGALGLFALCATLSSYFQNMTSPQSSDLYQYVSGTERRVAESASAGPSFKDLFKSP